MNMHKVYHTTLSQVTGYNIVKNERVCKLCVSPAMPVSSPWYLQAVPFPWFREESSLRPTPHASQGQHPLLCLLPSPLYNLTESWGKQGWVKVQPSLVSISKSWGNLSHAHLLDTCRSGFPSGTAVKKPSVMQAVMTQASLVVQTVRSLLAMWETLVWSSGGEDPLEKQMATHSSILAWRIPWLEKLGGLQSIGRRESDTQLSDEHTHKPITIVVV